MKFGKSLSNQIEETLPEWRDKFLSYKDLKKKLKLIQPNNHNNNADSRPNKRHRVVAGDCTGGGGGGGGGMTEEEIDFIKLLEAELEKFNSFFVEKEEEYIIRLKELQDSVANAKGFNEEMMKIRKEIVDFHGEMILLENYSALNYTGLVKILKKYDKRTGALIRLPFIQRVLQQPFFTTDLLNKLVKECETMLDGLFPTNETLTSAENVDAEETCDPTTPGAAKDDNSGILRIPRELAEIENMEGFYMKSTISALRVLKEIRSVSSTVSVFSLPPLQGLDDTLKNVPVVEQVAK